MKLERKEGRKKKGREEERKEDRVRKEGRREGKREERKCMEKCHNIGIGNDFLCVIPKDKGNKRKKNKQIGLCEI
jgi:hypothetical protein